MVERPGGAPLQVRRKFCARRAMAAWVAGRHYKFVYMTGKSRYTVCMPRIERAPRIVDTPGWREKAH